MGFLLRIVVSRWFLGGALGLSLSVSALFYWAWRAGIDGADLKNSVLRVEAFLQAYPVALFGALVVLPGLPIPTSALLVMAGVVWRQQPTMACLLSALALTLNLTWTYWLAAGPARKWVDRLMQASALRVPEMPAGHHLKWIFVLKLTPGIPLFFQNYLLGFLRAPFGPYLGVSVLCNGVVGSGMVLSGAGVADGNLAPLLTGLSLVALAAVLTQWVRCRGKA
jgi:uncharacterized membrane protein YdjX (TVP38/TMEM64 family)